MHAVRSEDDEDVIFLKFYTKGMQWAVGTVGRNSVLYIPIAVSIRGCVLCTEMGLAGANRKLFVPRSE